MFRDMVRSMPRDGRVVVGMALMYVWTWLLYWGGPYSLRTFTIELTNARWGANVVMCAVAVGLVVLAAHRMPGAKMLGFLRVAGLASGLIGIGLGLVLVLFPAMDEGMLFAVALADGVFTGLGEGFLLCLWCTITAALGIRVALAYNVFAMVVSGLIFLVCNLLPTWFALAVGLLCPVGGYACSAGRGRYEKAFVADAAPEPVSGASAVHGAPAGSSRDAAAPTASPAARIAPFAADRSFAMLALVAVIFGVSHGFMNASFEVVPEENYWFSCYGVVVGTVLAAAITFLTAYLLKMDAWQLVFRTSIPLMAAAYLLFPYELFWYVGPGLHALGYQYFFITFWSLLGSKQLRRDEPAVCSVSLGLFAVSAGAAAGLCLWNVAFAGIASEGLRVVSSVAVFLIVVVAVSLERPRFGWGNVRPGAGEVVEQGRGVDLSDAMARIAADYGLSKRELDVCALLGRGRNRQFVADELGISLETAKTHAANVYRKLAIHSQQELLDVIEATCDTLARERQAAIVR